MKTIYLHIGTHKTGTTSIQKVLSANQAEMLEKGYYYPKEYGIKITPGNHLLAWSILHGDQMFHAQTGKTLDLSATWKDFLEEIPSLSENIIISSEYFSLFSHENLLTLREYLADFRVVPIIYMRKQDEFLLSMYSEDVKSNGCFEPLMDFIERQKNKVDYIEILERWGQVFGKENIIVGIYHPTGYGSGLIGDFLEKIGLDLGSSSLKLGDRRFNVNPPVKFLKVVRFINWLIHG